MKLNSDLFLELCKEYDISLSQDYSDIMFEDKDGNVTGKGNLGDLAEFVAKAWTFGNAGYHNSIYRGKYLGDHVTDEQWEAIQNGTFEGMYIGDYWVINGVNWRIAAFDYWLRTGDKNWNDSQTNKIIRHFMI